MAKKLATYVYVTDEQQRPRAFGPDDEVPQWAASQITNPKAWAEPESGSDEETSETTAKKSRSKKTGE